MYYEFTVSRKTSLFGDQEGFMFKTDEIFLFDEAVTVLEELKERFPPPEHKINAQVVYTLVEYCPVTKDADPRTLLGQLTSKITKRVKDE